MGLTITRRRAQTDRVEAVASKVAGLGTPCIGCSDCRGLCQALIEVMVVPEVVLGETAAGE
ncbi:hypothetical protein N4R57_16630 [Rhodobacteraceae bacterium D3-12]|nr:hypothetical protein N4R57_16630 [Rhodobacteraceae bacterium D3-12]